MRALIGLAIVAGHLAGFAALASRSAGTELEVDVRSPLWSPVLAIDGTVPPQLAERVTAMLDTPGPGLRRERWRVAYRGGFTREVAATQLVGPFQAPSACTGRVVVGQRLLDDGHAGPGTIAGTMLGLIDAELAGEAIFAIGKYQRVEHLSLQWARLETRWFDRALVGPAGAPNGYVRAAATIVFDRVNVPIVIALVPEPTGDHLHFRIAAHADLSFDNRVVQWASDKLGGDQLATRLASRQIDAGLVTTLAPPPPFVLPSGEQLRFTYCSGAVEIVDQAFGALPFGVAFGVVAKAPAIRPPHFAPRMRAAPSASTTLAIDLDLDALNALLFELWRTGELDRQLDHVGLDRRFNADPIVTEYLSIRLSPIRLALPPVVEPGPHGLRLAADARVTIGDGARELATGRLYGALDFHFDRALERGARLPLAVELGGLELACERTATKLVPCYADLVAALADRGAEFHGALTDALGKLLVDLFVGRRLSTGPADVEIHDVTPSLAASQSGLHLELAATVATTGRP